MRGLFIKEEVIRENANKGEEEGEIANLAINREKENLYINKYIK
jgi:hypothetical protein